MMANAAGLAFQVSVMVAAFSLAALIGLFAFLAKKSAALVADLPDEERADKSGQARSKVRTDWVVPIDLAGFFGLCSLFAFLCFGNISVSEDVKPESANAFPGLVMNIVIFAVILLMTVALVYRRIKPVEWLGLRWSQWYLALCSPFVVVAMWCLVGLLQFLGYFSWMEFMCGSPSTQDSVKMLQESKDLLVVGAMSFMAVIMAPLVEETIFRGYLYPVMKRWLGIWPSLLITSLVFAAGHGSAALMLPLFVLGILLVLSYEFTGSILMPMAIHACFNGATVLAQLAIRFVTEIPPTAP
jgi:membrane protease YdiL (CAAX protease family)